MLDATTEVTATTKQKSAFEADYIAEGKELLEDTCRRQGAIYDAAQAEIMESNADKHYEQDLLRTAESYAKIDHLRTEKVELDADGKPKREADGSPMRTTAFDQESLDRPARKLVKIEGKQAKIRERQDHCKAIIGPARSILAREDETEEKLGPRVALVIVPHEEIEYRDGTVEPLRVQITKLAKRRGELKNSRLTIKEAKARIPVQIEHLAGQYKLDIAKLFRRKVKPEHEWLESPQAALGSYIEGIGALYGPIDSLCAIAKFFPEKLAAMLEAEVDAYGELEGKTHIATDDARKQLAKLKADLFALEHKEEAIIRAAARINLDIPRRKDADPRAVFGWRMA